MGSKVGDTALQTSFRLLIQDLILILLAHHALATEYAPATDVDGWCKDEGLWAIENMEDCRTACAALGRVGNGKITEKPNGNNFVGEWKFKGPQCFVAVNGAYKGNCHWNTKTDGTQEGGRNRAVCKTTPPPNKYVPAKSVDGSCGDENLVDMKNENECRTACAALGRVGNGKPNGNNFVGEWQFKGPQCFVAVNGAYKGNCHWNTKTDGTQEGG